MDPNIETLRRRARHTVERHAGVRAVVLFGSRARGLRVRADSDYDVALITDAALPDDCLNEVRRAYTHDLDVDFKVVSVAQLCAEGHLLGSFPRELRRDATLLAGEWPPKEVPPMARRRRYRPIPIDNATLAGFLIRVAGSVSEATMARAQRVQCERLGETWWAENADKTYQGAVQMAGELWAKSALMVFGVEPYETHEMDVLAGKLATQAKLGDGDAQAWAAKVHALNGASWKLRQADYDSGLLEPKPDADARFKLTMETFADWLRAGFLTRRAMAQEHAKRVEIRDKTRGFIGFHVAQVDSHPNVGALPQDIAQALLRFEHRATGRTASRPGLEAAAKVQARTPRPPKGGMGP